MKAKTRNVVMHPASWTLAVDAMERFMDLREEHKRASDHMWAGMLARTFSNNELALLTDYLSPHDYELLKGIAR